jgi:hypothetical protein
MPTSCMLYTVYLYLYVRMSRWEVAGGFLITLIHPSSLTDWLACVRYETVAVIIHTPVIQCNVEARGDGDGKTC